MKKTIEFLKEVLAEAKHIVWPTRKHTIFSTIAVVVVSFAISYYLGLFDFLFTKGLENLLNR